MDRVRAPLGLLVAAGFLSTYHFALWRRERALLAGARPRARTIGRVTLVTSADPEALSKAITDATGATVTVWKRTDAGHALPPADGAAPGEPDLVGRVVTALAGVTATHVLLVISQGTRVDVIPLETSTGSP